MSKKLKRGDQWTTRDRLWAVVDHSGKVVFGGFAMSVWIYRTRAAAKMNCPAWCRIVRISDLEGIVQ